MNTELDVLARLGELSEDDRSWILSKLPAHARKKLLAIAPKKESVPPADQVRQQTSAESSKVEEGIDAEDVFHLRRADPRALAELLRNEPAYLIAALLKADHWSWRDELLQAMPHIQRADITNLSESVRLAPEMSASLVKLLARRLSQASPPTQTRSRFEALVERIAASRSRRRSTLL